MKTHKRLNIEFNEDSGVGIIAGWIRYSVSAVLMSAECEGQNQFCDNMSPAAPAPFYPPPAKLSPVGALHNSSNLSRFLWLGSQYSQPENCECLDRELIISDDFKCNTPEKLLRPYHVLSQTEPEWVRASVQLWTLAGWSGMKILRIDVRRLTSYTPSGDTDCWSNSSLHKSLDTGTKQTAH